jgi:hypothetical protein
MRFSLKASGMPKSALALILLLNFGPPVYWGFTGAGLSALLAWSAGMAAFAVASGWRHVDRGIVASVWTGMWLAVAANVPTYVLGRFLATL